MNTIHTSGTIDRITMTIFPLIGSRRIEIMILSVSVIVVLRMIRGERRDGREGEGGCECGRREIGGDLIGRDDIVVCLILCIRIGVVIVMSG